jgi:hypothetical protein
MRDKLSNVDTISNIIIRHYTRCQHKSNAIDNGYIEVRVQTHTLTPQKPQNHPHMCTPVQLPHCRAVSEEEKAFALGLQVVMLRLFAYIPAPIIFGSVIDTTCLVWKMNECQQDGTTCLLYDIEAFRLRYGLVAMGFKVCYIVILWYRNVYYRFVPWHCRCFCGIVYDDARRIRVPSHSRHRLRWARLRIVWPSGRICI